MSERILIGDRLKELREKTKVNQEVVAIAIGISRARYSHYENNHVEPDIELIGKLADYYNVTTDYLLGKSNNPNLVEDAYIDEEIKKLQDDLQVWYIDEPKDKKMKLQMLERMLKSFQDDEK